MSWKSGEGRQERRKVNTGSVDAKVSTGSDWGSVLLGSSERLCRTHLRTVRPKGEKAAHFTHQLRPGTGLESLLRH